MTPSDRQVEALIPDDVAALRERARFMREGVLDLQREYGRLNSIPVDEFVVLLAVSDRRAANRNAAPPNLTRGTHLLLTDLERLEAWSVSVSILFDGSPPYLVGSALVSPSYRDLDLRLILEDDDFDRDWSDPVKLRTMNHALSTWGQRETGLPIDFQIQRQTDANAAFPGPRNAMGLRDWQPEPGAST